MFKERTGERDYARLNDPTSAKTNRYGTDIDLTCETGVSLKINGDAGVGENPNRNKQHGFHFTADNCIGCHACESACSEKNDLPPHLAFRSVGYVEGGTWPDYTRVNISMACNHCDDPVCLKGCPTRAYTKHPEYGAVIQDPDICFGCGYCTWVCPYNAPQLDPVAGHVQKCNMCVDRLEVGLKPACVSACLGNALNFGVIENAPQGRQQTKTEIPGFPDPSITHPNIRFEQTRSLPKDFTRTDSAVVKYQRDDGASSYSAHIDDTKILGKSWGLKKLSSRENPLVIFTLASQAVIGAFSILFLGAMFGITGFEGFVATWGYVGFLAGLLGVQGFALFLSTLHLGKPWRFYRGFNNLRYSPLSREALGVALFFTALGGHALFSAVEQSGLISEWANVVHLLRQASGLFAVIFAIIGLYFMTQIYRIKARPFWDHWHVTATFFGTALSLGGVLSAIVLLTLTGTVPSAVAVPIALGLVWEGLGLLCHARDLKKKGGEGGASLRVQTSQFFGAYTLRNAILALSLFAVVTLTNPMVWIGLAVSILTMSIIGRSLFYVLVIPTTMPGAFFWKNKGFEEHARETGLADLPQCGVVSKSH